MKNRRAIGRRSVRLLRLALIVRMFRVAKWLTIQAERMLIEEEARNRGLNPIVRQFGVSFCRVFPDPISHRPPEHPCPGGFVCFPQRLERSRKGRNRLRSRPFMSARPPIPPSWPLDVRAILRTR
jgi:hypothetical protein